MAAHSFNNNELSITRDVNKKYYRNFLEAAVNSKEDSSKLGGAEHAERYIVRNPPSPSSCSTLKISICRSSLIV